MKKVLLFLLITLVGILTGCSTTPNTTTEAISYDTTSEYTNYVTIKYRNDPVDISNFEALDTSNSSLVRGAWYDEANQYMIIDLNGTKYHYCRFPTSVWDDFKLTDSFGTYYKSYIKGNYDCRNGGVPSY